jgi:hypothetical protein
LTLELRFNRCARKPLVPNFGPDLVRFEKGQGLRETSTGHGDVLGEFLAAGDHTRSDSFLSPVLKKAGRSAGIKGVNHQMLRRTCSTYMAQLTTVKRAGPSAAC